LHAPGLEYDQLLSRVYFDFNLRPYTMARFKRSMDRLKHKLGVDIEISDHDGSNGGH
jgi:hypothetical protein